MAHMNQDIKSKIVNALKPIMNKYGLKATYSVRSKMALSVNIASGKLDFLNNYNNVVSKNLKYTSRGFTPAKNSLDINQYWYHEQFDGEVKDCIEEIIDTIKTAGEYYDHSDIQSDYFNTAFYFDINVGRWDKPYSLVA
jgi:hypothetical protein